MADPWCPLPAHSPSLHRSNPTRQRFLFCQALPPWLPSFLECRRVRCVLAHPKSPTHGRGAHRGLVFLPTPLPPASPLLATNLFSQTGYTKLSIASMAHQGAFHRVFKSSFRAETNISIYRWRGLLAIGQKVIELPRTNVVLLFPQLA